MEILCCDNGASGNRIHWFTQASVADESKWCIWLYFRCDGAVNSINADCFSRIRHRSANLSSEMKLVSKHWAGSVSTSLTSS